MELGTQIIILIVAIVLSGFFSGIETAFFSLDRLRIKHLLKEKRSGAKTVEKLKSNPQRLLTTILIGNNVANIGASAIATSIAIQFAGSYAVGIATGIMTLIILIFGEITPKSLAVKHNETVALMVSKPLLILQTILLPISFLFESLANLITGSKKERPIVTEEEIKTFVSVGAEAGQVKATERELIHRIFRFDDLNASEIMVPKPDMILLNANDSIKEHVNFFIKMPHTRIPIYEKNKDKIIGVVHVKDVLKAIYHKRINKKLRSLMKPIFFVPETKKLDTLLKQFKIRNQHIAIVVDEYGVVTGLITLEDVLEEIVGEIQDETDIVDPNVEKISQNKWKIKGKTDIQDVNKKLRLRLKEHADFETFGGYILHEIGRIPKKGETINIKRLKITINRKTGQRILDTTVKKI